MAVARARAVIAADSPCGLPLERTRAVWMSSVSWLGPRLRVSFTTRGSIAFEFENPKAAVAFWALLLYCPKSACFPTQPVVLMPEVCV